MNGKLTRHHIVPRSRHGKSKKYNLLMLEKERHQFWHILFGNRTIREAIELLERIDRAKNAQK
jgi:5-methylcytosine-specific restriction endonuclease McrA